MFWAYKVSDEGLESSGTCLKAITVSDRNQHEGLCGDGGGVCSTKGAQRDLGSQPYGS